MFRLKTISALSLSLSFPTVIAESKSEKGKSKEKPNARMIKPSQLPIYEEPSDFFKYEYYGKEKSKLVEGISVVRKELESVYDATEDARTTVKHVYETGKAHTLTTVDYVLDEENVAAKVGAITVGGLLGLLIGGRRKGFLKKIFYTSVGASGAAALVYPKEASRLSKEIYNNADDYYPIVYNFIAGIKPQGETKPPGPAEAAAAAAAKDPPQKPPTEVSTRPRHAFESLLRQSRDVALWGFRLFDRESPGARRPQEWGASAEDPLEDKYPAEMPRGPESPDGSLGSLVAGVVRDLAEEGASCLVSGAADEVARDASRFSEDAAAAARVARKAEAVLSVFEMASQVAAQTHHLPPSARRKAAAAEEVAKRLDGVAEAVEGAADEAEALGRAAAEGAAEVKRSADEFGERREQDIEQRIKERIAGGEAKSTAGGATPKRVSNEQLESVVSVPAATERRREEEEERLNDLGSGKEEEEQFGSESTDEEDPDWDRLHSWPEESDSERHQGAGLDQDDSIRIVQKLPEVPKGGETQIEDFTDVLIESMLNIRILPPEEGDEGEREREEEDNTEQEPEESEWSPDPEPLQASSRSGLRGMFALVKDKLLPQKATKEDHKEPKEDHEEPEEDIDDMDKRFSGQDHDEVADEISTSQECSAEDAEQAPHDPVVPIGSEASRKGTPAKDVVVKSPKSAAPAAPVQGDVGMSLPEDKDMYTTRS